MGRRRTGSIIERGDRFEAWVAKTYLGIHDTRAIAQRVIDQWLRELDGKTPDVFGEYGEAWLDRRETAGHVRSVQKERSVWNAHIRKAPFYDAQFKRITPMMMQQWFGELLKTPAMHAVKTKAGVELRPLKRTLSRKTASNILQVASRCFDFAVVDAKITSNPAAAIIKPPAATKRRETQLVVHLTKSELRALFKAPLPPFQRAAYAVAIYAGLRKGELWGLRWQDVDLTGRQPCIRVRYSYDGDVKTDTSVRDVPLLPPAREALAAWKALQTPTPIAGLVFPADGGECHHSSYTAQWRDHIEGRGDERTVRPGWRSRVGLRAAIKFHDFRHTCGCHLIQGTWTPRPLSLEEVKTWLGHSSISVTERHYAWMVPGNLHDAVARRRGHAVKAGDSPGHEVDE